MGRMPLDVMLVGKDVHLDRGAVELQCRVGFERQAIFAVGYLDQERRLEAVCVERERVGLPESLLGETGRRIARFQQEIAVAEAGRHGRARILAASPERRRLEPAGMEQGILRGRGAVAEPGDADPLRIDRAGGDCGVDAGIERREIEAALGPAGDRDPLVIDQAVCPFRAGKRPGPLKTEHREAARGEQLDRNLVAGAAAKEAATGILNDH